MEAVLDILSRCLDAPKNFFAVYANFFGGNDPYSNATISRLKDSDLHVVTHKKGLAWVPLKYQH